MNLGELLRRSAAIRPEAPAVVAPDATLTFAELDRRADAVATRLAEAGVTAGDRVAVWMPKSAAALASMQAALRLGAAYVPCDPLSPPARIETILKDCAVRALVVARDGADPGRDVITVAIDEELPPASPRSAACADVAPDQLAYILYTSGSTGRPKGVCISHRAALAFAEWAAREIAATADDRFANHAPFHFDLSVFDVYAAWAVGAPVVIVPEGLAYDPRRLREFIVSERISVWYSVPSALMLMIDRGGLLLAPIDGLRVVVFAGEPFPIKHLVALRARLPRTRMWNFYGPTETNVCTAYEVIDIPADRVAPVPIGTASCGDRVWAADEDGREVADGEPGELWVTGPTVMNGYWGGEPAGDRPYRTGDLVVRNPDGNYEYIGRRDQMVKVRGYRVELGEIEAVLQNSPRVREVAVVARGDGLEAKLVAFVASGEDTPSLLEAKRLCAERLPRYMIVDELRIVEALPRTRNGKVDRAALRARSGLDGGVT